MEIFIYNPNVEDGVIVMKKRRGKQPVKPNISEAMKERLVYLKGVQGSTMNIPIIYRRTFDWESDSVVFKPMNKRAFIVYRSDLDNEELDPANFITRELYIDELPWYHENRVGADKKDRSRNEELREMLVSHSLADRFVHVDIPKPEDKELDMALREDLESLSDELGYSYSTIPGAYRCTFTFPRHTNEQMVNRSVSVLRSTIKVLYSLINDLLELKRQEVMDRMDEVHYSIGMAEINLDRIYTDSLNVHWDLPNTEPAGYFLLSQVCERAHDEIEYLVDSSIELLEMLDCCIEDDDVLELLYEEMISVWRSSIGKALNWLESVIETVDQDEEEAMKRCLTIIREYRSFKQNRSSIQDRYISELASKIEGLSARSTKNGGIKLFARKECIGSIELLFLMNQTAARLWGLTKIFATKQLYLINSQI